jgi:hypothetical protein
MGLFVIGMTERRFHHRGHREHREENGGGGEKDTARREHSQDSSRKWREMEKNRLFHAS